ncbi:MAG: thermonuclease family protein [Spirochaetes bacterium]|nr:thermonuclease family protein [Spirochaetota bacterium]
MRRIRKQNTLFLILLLSLPLLEVFAAPLQPVPRPAGTKEVTHPSEPQAPEGKVQGGPKTLYRVHIANLKSYKDADLSQMAKATVTRVVDGDTIEVALEGKAYKVRLIGVDTPETVAPGRAVERFGKEASQFTRSKLEKKTVYLAFDWELNDRYGRLLAYVYLPDRTCFNAELIRLGYGHAYTKYPFQFLEEFRKLEAEARQAKRGLWKSSK